MSRPSVKLQTSNQMHLDKHWMIQNQKNRNSLWNNNKNRPNWMMYPVA